MNSREEERADQAGVNAAKQIRVDNHDSDNKKGDNDENDEHLDEFYADIEDVSTNFNRVQEAIVEYDNSIQKISYEDSIRILKKLEQSIMYHSLFSPNEDFQEVATENIKYMLIPYYLAEVFGRMTGNRKASLHFSKLYMDEFIKLVNHYGLLTKEQRKKWKEILDDPKYEPTREEKIGQYKDKKAMETKIKDLEKVTNEDNQREILTLILNTKILNAFDDIRMINLEFQMHEHRDKLEKERQENPNKKEELKPLPKMKVWKVDKPAPNPNADLPRMIAGAQNGGLCHQHMHEIRADFQKQVFQPGGTQPTVTLDEFAEIQMAEMAEQQRKMKEAQDAAALEKDNSSDEEVDIRKTKEKRAWDDWKDLHDKGEGNRNGNR